MFTDISSHLPTVNLKLQQREQLINALFSHVRTFHAKPKLFEQKLDKKDLSHFPLMAHMNCIEQGWAKISTKKPHVKIQNCRRATNSAGGVSANTVNKASFNQIIKTNTTLHDSQFFRNFTRIRSTVDFRFIS